MSTSSTCSAAPSQEAACASARGANAVVQTDLSWPQVHRAATSKIFSPSHLQTILDDIVAPIARARDEAEHILILVGIDTTREMLDEVQLRECMENQAIRDDFTRYAKGAADKEASLNTLGDVFDHIAAAVERLSIVVSNVQGLHSMAATVANVSSGTKTL